MKKQIMLCTILAVMPMTVLAASTDNVDSVVNYQYVAQKWVNAVTVGVNVGVHVAAKDLDLSTVKNTVMRNLARVVSQATWHTVTIVRSQDAAGLQTVYLQLQTRVSPTAINQLSEKLHALSKAGAQYKVLAIDFQPSVATVQQAYQTLRQEIYQHVKQEMQQLDKTFPNQHYAVHKLTFSAAGLRLPQAVNLSNSVNMFVKQMQQPNNNTSMPVARRLTLLANVELAATKGQQ